MKNYYEILEVEKTASSNEIKKAYFKLVRKYPPDRFQEEFIEIRHAYETLSDSKTREDYDRFSEIPPSLMELFDEAMACKEDGDYDYAIGILENFKEEIQKYIVLQSALAELYSDNCNSQKAIRILEDIVKKDPENAGFSVRLAEEYYERGWNKKALKEYERAIGLDEDNISVWLGIINFVSDTQSYDAAQIFVKKAIEISEKNNWDNTEIHVENIRNAAMNGNFQEVSSSIKVLRERLNGDIEDKENIAWLIYHISYEILKTGAFEIAKEAIDTALVAMPQEKAFIEAKTILDEKVLSAQKFRILKEEKSISDILSKMLSIILQPSKEKRNYDTFFEVYYLFDFEEARKEIRMIKQHYPEVLTINPYYFNRILNKDFVYDIPDVINGFIIEEDLSNDFMKFIKQEGLDEEKGKLLLEKGENRKRSTFDDFEPFILEETKVGRNEPCTCGSGKKYKKCCG